MKRRRVEHVLMYVGKRAFSQTPHVGNLVSEMISILSLQE